MSLVRRVAVSATALALLAGTAATIGAATPAIAAPATSCLTRVQHHADAAIAHRLATLTKLQTRVDASKKITAAHKSTIDSIISSDETNLAALKVTIDGDTTCATAKVDAAKIVIDYRIYRLLVPQTHLTKAVDRAEAHATKLLAVAAKLQTRITAGANAEKNVTAAQTDDNALVADVTAAQTALSGVVDSLLALTPSEFSPHHGDLKAARTALHTAQVDLRHADRALTKTRHALKTAGA